MSTLIFIIQILTGIALMSIGAYVDAFNVYVVIKSRYGQAPSPVLIVPIICCGAGIACLFAAETLSFRVSWILYWTLVAFHCLLLFIALPLFEKRTDRPHHL